MLLVKWKSDHISPFSSDDEYPKNTHSPTAEFPCSFFDALAACDVADTPSTQQTAVIG